jgi:group I intron endonuclease
MKSGIYLIQCLVNGKCYIGQSNDVYSRIRDHKNKLKTNKHNNLYIQRAWNKYGEENFSFSECIMCPIEDLDNYERFYIKLFSCLDFGYNLESGGNLNKTISETSRKKMSIAKKGKPSLHKGRKASEDLKLKLSLAHKGLPSPRKGIKTGKPAWNSGKKGLQVSPKRIKVEVFDSIENKSLGIFDSKMHFVKSINYKSKNFIKVSNSETKIGKYRLLKL